MEFTRATKGVQGKEPLQKAVHRSVVSRVPICLLGGPLCALMALQDEGMGKRMRLYGKQEARAGPI